MVRDCLTETGIPKALYAPGAKYTWVASKIHLFLLARLEQERATYRLFGLEEKPPVLHTYFASRIPMMLRLNIALDTKLQAQRWRAP